MSEEAEGISKLLESCKVAEEVGGKVEIVGRWPWARFEGKPSEEAREALKSAGWRWSRNKLAWYIPNGGGRYRRGVSLEFLRQKFGSSVWDAGTFAYADGVSHDD